MTRVDALLVVVLMALASWVRAPLVDPPVTGEELAWLADGPIWPEIMGAESVRNPPLYRIVVSELGGPAHTIALGRALGIGATLLGIFAVYLAGLALDPTRSVSALGALIVCVAELHADEFAVYRANTLCCALLAFHAWATCLFVSERSSRTSEATRWSSAALLPHLHYLMLAPLLGMALGAVLASRRGRALGPAALAMALAAPLGLVVLGTPPGYLAEQWGTLEDLVIDRLMPSLAYPITFIGAGLLLSSPTERRMLFVVASGWWALLATAALAMVLAPPVRPTLGAMAIGLTALATAAGAIAIAKAGRTLSPHGAYLAVGPLWVLVIAITIPLAARRPPFFLATDAHAARRVAREDHGGALPLVISPEWNAMLTFHSLDAARWRGVPCDPEPALCLSQATREYRSLPPAEGRYQLALLDEFAAPPRECTRDGSVGGARLYTCRGD